jgi:hypothetical protein
MNLQQLFLQRHNILHESYLNGVFFPISDEMLRKRPDPRVNSIVWNLWHLLRSEDYALNRFVTDGSQVFDDGGWQSHLNIPWRHTGYGMTFAEVDELNGMIDIQALRDYAAVVKTRTCDIVERLDPASLDVAPDIEHIHTVLFDEGYAMASEAAGLEQNYTGWSKGRWLMALGLTHSFEHVGQMGVIASLLDLNI